MKADRTQWSNEDWLRHEWRIKTIYHFGQSNMPMPRKRVPWYPMPTPIAVAVRSMFASTQP